MMLLMQKLGMLVQPFALHRLVRLRRKKVASGQDSLRISAIDPSGVPMDVFTTVTLKTQGSSKRQVLQKEPFDFSLAHTDVKKSEVVLSFRGHYGESPVNVPLPKDSDVTLELQWDPYEGKWRTPQDSGVAAATPQ